MLNIINAYGMKFSLLNGVVFKLCGMEKTILKYGIGFRKGCFKTAFIIYLPPSHYS